MLEIFLGLIENIKWAVGFTLLCLIFTIITRYVVICSDAEFCERDEKNRQSFVKKFITWGPLLIPFILFCCLPSVEDVWKIRISLIKFQLASPENIKKGEQEIIRIAHELECKYLTCKEDKK